MQTRGGVALLSLLLLASSASAFELNPEELPIQDAGLRELVESVNDEFRPAEQEAQEHAQDGEQEAATLLEAIEPFVSLAFQSVVMVQQEVDRTTSDVPDMDSLLGLTSGQPESEPASTSAAPVEEDLGWWVAGVTAGSLVVAWIAASLVTSALGGGAGAAAGGLTASSAARAGGLTLFGTTLGQILEHPNRARLYELISASPGVRLQDLCDETGLSRTAVTHHLRVLERAHVIVSERAGRSIHFFENGGRYGSHQKAAYAVLQNERTRAVAEHIKSNPATDQKSVCAAMGLAASVVHWHVQRLVEAEIITSRRDGRRVRYFPNTPL